MEIPPELSKRDMMNNGHFHSYTNKYSPTIEIAAGVLGVTFLIYTLREMLITGSTILPHDHIYWGYPVFQFYAENIVNGHFPLWDPFTHGGEPFYPFFMHMKLLDPITLLTIYIGRLITKDIAILYNWNYFLQILVTLSGVYWVLRSLSENILIRISLVPILLYSSFMLSPFRQAGIICQFMWIPFIIQFLLRIVYHKDYRWHNWIMLGGLTGINWQSYYFSGTWTILFTLFSGLFIFHRHLLSSVLRSRNFALKITLTSVIIFIMMLPNIVLFLDKDKYVYPARMIQADYENEMPLGGPQQSEGNSLSKSQGIIMPYKLIAYTGTFSTIWDFIQFISPEGNIFIQKHSSKNNWGNPSEAYMYIGLLPWAIGLLGIVAGRHELKKIWLFMLVFFGLLMLGPAGGLHRLLFYLYPPLWFVRHTHTFAIFFLFAFLYFYILGFNYIFSTWKGYINPFNNTEEGPSELLSGRKQGIKYLRKIIVLILFPVSLVGLVYWMTRLEYPGSNYIFLLIILCVIIGWLLRKDLGRKGILAGLISSQIALVLIFNTHPLYFLIKVFLLLIAPFVLFLIIERNKSLSGKYYLAPALIVIFSVSLIGDLTGHLHLASPLYKGQNHPQKAFGLDTFIHSPQFINNRLIAPPSHYGDGADSQSIRYLSYLYRQPYVFSPVMSESTINLIYDDITTDVLNNNSFEEWSVSPDHILIPNGFFYEQDGTGGFPGRYEQKNGIMKGRYSALLSPSSHGNSMLRFYIADLAEFRGGSIKASVWVKSTNTTDDAVQFDLQDGLSNVKVMSYSNSGDWENLELVSLINENAKELLFTMNVKHTATSEVWFDEIKINLTTDFREFDKGLYSKRWNSFSLPKKYFELINLDIPPRAMKEMFAVGKPLFQFKQGIVGTDETDVAPFLTELGPARAVRLLNNYALVNNSEVDSSLRRFKISSSDYSKLIHNNSYKQENPQRKIDLSCSVVEYDYNSLGMNVSSDKEGILYWSDGYDSRWQAYVNGMEMPVYRANVNFKAIALPQGTSHIKFIYEHPLINIALLAYYCAFIISGVLALISWLYERRKASISN